MARCEQGTFRVVKLCLAYVIAVAAMVPVPATAQSAGPPALAFDGTARTGSDTRTVRFRFFCSSNEGRDVTGVLAVDLETPRYEQLRAIFDFDPFEGPDSTEGALSALQTSGAHGKAVGRFTAAGSAAEGTGALSFVLEVNASRREAGPLKKLGTVLRPLLDGPARLVWVQGNAKKGGAPLTATLDLTPVQSDQLRAALGPCLNGR
jgi:hypothetical protein